MDNREVIDITVSNMKRIYRDVGQLVQIIEEGLKNYNFESFGNDAACTWEVSRSLKEPDSWLYTYFARAYSRTSNLKRAVGFCLHLGGYPASDVTKLEQLGITFPFINVSLVEQKESFEYKDAKIRIEVWEWLWGAGWWESARSAQRKTEGNVIKEVFQDGARNTTYFVDLLSLNNKELIHQIIIEPMKRMYEGNEDWIIEAALPTINVTFDTIP